MKRDTRITILFSLIMIMAAIIYLTISNDHNVYVVKDRGFVDNRDIVHIEINIPDKEEDIMLSYQEIQEYNKEIASKTTDIYDLNQIKTLKIEQIQEYILKYTMPENKYYKGKLITEEEKQEILDNRALDNIKDIKTMKKGIIVERSNLRSFPTNNRFYDQKSGSDEDRIQETELLANTPVLIIHESKDKLWNFVISPLYMGWVRNDTIALAKSDDYEYFINPSQFGIITDSSLEVDGKTLDMSVKLPYKKDNIYVMPIKKENGYVGKKEVTIIRGIHLGYLNYTKDNVIKQAYKYEGTSYSWGGLNRNVDCSSFIANVYRTFGFVFPRNTSSQNESVGEVISLSGKSEKEKLKLINGTEPSLLYQDGHVMLYIGTEDNKHYIIHASGEGSVRVTALESSSYIKKINKLVLVK